MLPLPFHKSSDLDYPRSTERVIVSLNTEDIFIKALESRADRIHRKGVSAHMDHPRVLREGEHRSSWIESDAAMPAGQV